MDHLIPRGQHRHSLVREVLHLSLSLSFHAHSALCLHLQVKLSRLCEQDKILKDLEARISSLKEDKVTHSAGSRGRSVNQTASFYPLTSVKSDESTGS